MPTGSPIRMQVRNELPGMSPAGSRTTVEPDASLCIRFFENAGIHGGDVSGLSPRFASMMNQTENCSHAG